MKILMPYISRFGEASSIYNPHAVAGGIEMFARLVYTHIPNVIPIELSQEDQKKRRVTKKIVRAAVKHRPDIILCNYNNGTMMTGVWKHLKIPILWINHLLPGSISTLNHLQLMDEFTKSQKFLSFVSQFQLTGYQERASQLHPDSKMFDDLSFINPCFCKELVQASNFDYDMVTIGRMNKAKDPFWLSKIAHNEFDYKIFSTRNTFNSKDEDYYEKHSEFHDRLILDQPHITIMNKLKKARAYVSTCPVESWGITTLEALQHGVPVIIRAGKKGHASSEIPASQDHVHLVSTRVKTEEVKEILQDFDKLDKNQIAKETFEKHTLEKWRTNLVSSLNKAINTYT